MILKIKPLSVNQIFKGKRFRTKEYDIYELQVISLLSKINIPNGNLSIIYNVGLSSKNGDIDNCIKPFQDIISKYYGFNDNRIYHLEVFKSIVKKGSEFISFELSEIEQIKKAKNL